jgi:hypothetical protein
LGSVPGDGAVCSGAVGGIHPFVEVKETACAQISRKACSPLRFRKRQEAQPKKIAVQSAAKKS